MEQRYAIVAAERDELLIASADQQRRLRRHAATVGILSRSLQIRDTQLNSQAEVLSSVTLERSISARNLNSSQAWLRMLRRQAARDEERIEELEVEVELSWERELPMATQGIPRVYPGGMEDIGHLWWCVGTNTRGEL